MRTVRVINKIEQKVLACAVVIALGAGLAACSNGSSTTSTTTVPQSAKTYLQQGLLAQKVGNYSQAKVNYQKAIAADPSNAGEIAALAYYDLGVISQRTRGELALSRSYYHKALALDPKLINATYNLAISYSPTNPIYAQTLFNRVLAKQPNNASALFYSGLLAYRQGNITLGVQRMKSAIALNPKLASHVPSTVNLKQ